jgi:hypothetical protein
MPDAIIHQATALAGGGFSRKLDKTFAQMRNLARGDRCGVRKPPL